MARVQRVLERLLVDQAAARAVDDAHALLRLGEILAAQDIARAVGERRVERDEVGTGQKIVERDLLDAHFHGARSEEHRSELQYLIRISYAVVCFKKKQNTTEYT